MSTAAIMRARGILAGADREWRSRLISRQAPATRWQDAFDRQPDDVKVVVNFAS